MNNLNTVFAYVHILQLAILNPVHYDYFFEVHPELHISTVKPASLLLQSNKQRRFFWRKLLRLYKRGSDRRSPPHSCEAHTCIYIQRELLCQYAIVQATTEPLAA